MTAGSKRVDTHVLSKQCKQCHIWEIRQGTPEYSNCKKTHACSVNHTASSGAMEAAGAIEMFQIYIDKKMIHLEYLEDDDTSSFKAVVHSKP